MSGLVPLEIDPSNSQQFSNVPAFVDSLFDPAVRASSTITSASDAGKLNASFADDNSAGLILRSWLAAWQHAQGDTSAPGYDSDAYHRCPSTDRSFITWLSGYIKKHGLVLAKPKLTPLDEWENDDGNRWRIYSNSGYKAKSFLTNGVWNYGEVTSNSPLQIGAGPYPTDTVVNFLYWMLYGAHFVVPSDDDDQTDGNGFTGLKDDFISSGLTTRQTWTSHYAKVVNTSCLNYLMITGQEEPSNGPLIASWVVGPTTDFGSNSFFQLEGWPVGGSSTGERHGADFDAHEATLWNISTYGACVYSEKRSTTCFLAHSKFDLTIHTDTMMPHYAGAGSHQSWMHTELVQNS
jgi:hypothetical protein